MATVTRMGKTIIVGSRAPLRQQAFMAYNIDEQNRYIANTLERATAEFFRAYPQDDLCFVDAGNIELDNSFTKYSAWITEEVSRKELYSTTQEAPAMEPKNNVLKEAVRQVLLMADDRVKRTKETECVLHDGKGNFFAVGEDKILHSASLWAVRPRTEEELNEHVRLAASYGKPLYITNLRKAREVDAQALHAFYEGD